MQVQVEGVSRKVVVEHDLAAHKGLKRQRGEHVEPEAEPCNRHHGVVGREVVEHIAQRLVAKGQEAREGHEEAGEHRHARRVVRHAREPVYRRLLEGSVDEEGIVMTDKGCT